MRLRLSQQVSEAARKAPLASVALGTGRTGTASPLLGQQQSCSQLLATALWWVPRRARSWGGWQ